MKGAVIIFVTAISAVAVAELPPSNSYLPPPPVNRNAGYPRNPQSASSFPDAPQVIAARSFDQGSHGHGNGLSRSNPHDHAAQGRLGANGQAYGENAVSFARNEIDAGTEPAQYNFGYMVTDANEGTDFGHHEERLEERAQGEYHVVLPDGRKQTVSYEADERGFKPQISYQDTEELTRAGGYGASANTRNHGNGYQNGGDGLRAY